MMPDTPPGDRPAGPPVRPGHRLGPAALVLIVLGILAGLCATGAAVTTAWLAGTRLAAAAPGHATDALLDDVEAGRTGDAYRRLCAPARQNLTEAQFATLLAAGPKLTGHRIVSSQVRTVNGVRTATVTARLTLATGPDSHTFPLVRESGTWKVCGDPF